MNRSMKKAIRYTKRASIHQRKADHNAALARIYLAMSEEEEVSELRAALEEGILPTYEVELEDEPDQG